MANQGIEPAMTGASDFAMAQLRGPASRLATPASTEIGNDFILIILEIILVAERKAILYS
jgi:hypothetical protein